MNIVIIIEDWFCRKYLKHICKKISDTDNIMCFENSVVALDYIIANTIDVVFIDVDFLKLNAVILSNKIKNINENTALIFLSVEEEFAYKAIQLDAFAYILKPLKKMYIVNIIKELVNQKLLINS